MTLSRFIPCKITENTSIWLDWARAIAALIVLSGHCRSICFLNYSSGGTGGNFLFFPFYYITGFGHQAVVVFFVMSGYLVGGSVLKELIERDRIQFGRYAISRIVRIHSVLVPALLLGGMFDFLGIHWLQVNDIYAHSHYKYVLSWNVVEHLNVVTFLGNLACLHTIFVGVFGSNGPLWSLAIEFWFYFLFPSILISVWKERSLPTRLLSICTSILLFCLLGGELLWFPIWLAGVGIRLLPSKFTIKRPISLSIFLAALFAIKSPLSGHFGLELFSDYILTLGFCFVLHSFTHEPPSIGISASIWGKRCAGFSYTLYACHFPLLVFFAALINSCLDVDLPQAATKFMTWVYYISMLGVAIVCCWGLSFATEKKYHRLRNWLVLHLT